MDMEFEMDGRASRSPQGDGDMEDDEELAELADALLLLHESG